MRLCGWLELWGFNTTKSNLTFLRFRYVCMCHMGGRVFFSWFPNWLANLLTIKETEANEGTHLGHFWFYVNTTYVKFTNSLICYFVAAYWSLLVLWLTMIYTAIDNFYLTDEQLKNSPSRKDGIDEATEITLRIYGCDLIQESGILLRLYPALIFFFFCTLNLCWFI